MEVQNEKYLLYTRSLQADMWDAGIFDNLK
jgi:hypothetical protein